MYLANLSNKTIQHNTNLFYGYADITYTNVDDYKLTSGYVFVVGGGAITWRSKKQKTLALSSTEADLSPWHRTLNFINEQNTS